MPRRARLAVGLSLLLSLAVLPGVGGGPAALAQGEPDIDASRLEAMRWRNIGPFRGGRSVAATGVVGDRTTYYFGSTGGGVWKTTDAGETWDNVSDGYFGTGSVGAIAVAESDPNVVYVGMGEHAVRGVMTSHGDGVYRSTDGGRTWSHLGLEGTRVISRIRVHPDDPDRVFVAAQGAVHGPTEERGIYRSIDGGATWEKVLYVSERAGASDLSMDMTNPRILYAAFWDHLRRPWVVESGGEGSGIWKSTDGGDTWEELDEGLPELMGKIGVDVSRADPRRVYAIVEAEPDDGGLYRSDDGGATWRHLSDARAIQTRSWYYMEVYADPGDADTVHVLNAPYMRSIDGGRTFESVSVPHGDNHDLWIDPEDADRMINANDGGANVSFNGGESWSTQRNQPTAQFYRVNADEQFPYHVYGGQQDNSAIGIASAAPGGIGWDDFYSVAGCESAYLAFDPAEPDEVFGGCYQGLIDVWQRDSGESKPIMAYPYLGLGTFPRDQRYRFNWNAPIVASPHDPDVVYHAGNVVFRTTDSGQSWDVISPDLTRDDEEKQGPGGTPITNEGAGGENYNTIMYLEASPHSPDVLWVGTDDGLVHVTRDGGGSWEEVTPGAVGELGRESGNFPGEALINSIEVSPHDPATAWVVATRYKFDDLAPYVYRTRDFGASWETVVGGIGDEAWVRVVREDPERPGLLYAGTELGIYLSFDGGDSWQPWQLNLPVVPVTDLMVHRGDLIAATQGRSFWILDDLSPVRQITEEVLAASLHVFEPREQVMVSWGGGFGGGGARTGDNPPAGAQVFFWMAEEPEGPVTVEIVAADGEVVRTYATDPEEAGDEDFTELDRPSAGLERFSWDFRRDAMTPVEGAFVFGSLDGRLVPPGTYTVRVTAGDESASAELTLRPDPRREASQEQYEAQDAFLAEAAALVEDINRGINRLRVARDQLRGFRELTAERDDLEELREAAAELADAIDAWEEELVQTRTANFQDVINFENQFRTQVVALIGSVDGTEPPVTQGARERLADLQETWETYREQRQALIDRIAEINDRIRAAGVDPILVPGR